MKAELIVCSVINKRDVKAINQIVQLGYEMDSGDYIRGVEEERKNILSELVERQKIDFNRVKTIFKVGNPVHQIVRTAMDEGVDMIVMGIKANADLEHLIIGSVAEKVFRRSPITIVSYRDSSFTHRLK